jgi:hypothetical protein
MGINAQTSVPKFTSGDVLSAANTNLLTNAPPVFSGTATRDAAFGGAGEKTLAEGQLCYLEDSNIVQYYDGAAWASVGASGLIPITQTSNTFSGASAITFDTNTFTSTYKNYRAIITIRAATSDTTLTGRFRTSGTNNTSAIYSQYSPGNPTAVGIANQTSFDMGTMDSTIHLYCLTLDFIDPKVAGPCAAMGNLLYLDSVNAYQGRAINLGVYDTASFDSFTIISSAGTLTGTYRVYAYSE